MGKRKNTPTILFFNLLFLFYTAIGPVQALCYHLFNPSESHLQYVEHIVKTRLDKKYIQYSSNIISKTSKYKSSYLNFDVYNSDENFRKKSIVNKIWTKFYVRTFFSTIPIHIFYCSFRL